jgi:hypothetical protein
MISALDEAFLVTVYISYSKSWVNQWELKSANPGYTLRKKAKSPGDPPNVFLHDHNPPVIVVSNAKYFPLYVSNNVGSKESGGWSLQGIAEVSRLNSVSLLARARPESRALEERFLGMLRALDHNANRVVERPAQVAAEERARDALFVDVFRDRDLSLLNAADYDSSEEEDNGQAPQDNQDGQAPQDNQDLPQE